jgi:GT2 family glycosyltransferase
MLMPERIQTDIDIFESDPTLDFVYSKAKYIDAESKPMEKEFGLPITGHRKERFQLIWQTMCATYKRDFFEQTGGWDEDLPMWQDYELCQRILINYNPRFEFLNRSMAHYRFVPNSERIGNSKSDYEAARKRFPALLKLQKHSGYKGTLYVWIRSLLRILKCCKIFKIHGKREEYSVLLNDLKKTWPFAWFCSLFFMALPQFLIRRF